MLGTGQPDPDLQWSWGPWGLGWYVDLWLLKANPIAMVRRLLGPNFLRTCPFWPYSCTCFIAVHCHLWNCRSFLRTRVRVCKFWALGMSIFEIWMAVDASRRQGPINCPLDNWTASCVRFNGSVCCNYNSFRIECSSFTDPELQVNYLHKGI